MNEDNPKICFDAVPSEDVVDTSLKIECKNIFLHFNAKHEKLFKYFGLGLRPSTGNFSQEIFFFFNYILNE